MKTKQRIAVLANSIGILLLITYLLCISLGLIAPKYQMHQVWGPLLPGFEWLTWRGFLMGLIGAYAYGWYFAILWVPIHSYFEQRALRS